MKNVKGCFCAVLKKRRTDVKQKMERSGIIVGKGKKVRISHSVVKGEKPGVFKRFGMHPFLDLAVCYMLVFSIDEGGQILR